MRQLFLDAIQPQSDSVMKEEALRVLAQMEEPPVELLEGMTRAADDSERFVRWQAAKILGHYRDDAVRVAPALLRLLASEGYQSEIRREAMKSIGRLGKAAPRDAVEGLRHLQETYVGSESELQDLEQGYWDTPQPIEEALRGTGA